MEPELHLDPELLHLHARRVSAVLDALVPLPAPDTGVRGAVAAVPEGPAVLAELDRVHAAVGRAGAELAALAAALHEAAASAAATDADAARAFRLLEGEL